MESQAPVIPFPPQRLWTLDPLLESPAKLYIIDIVNMPEIAAGVFAYKSHPITEVDIMGKIVDIETFGCKLYKYIVDDGTGRIGCCKYSDSSVSESDSDLRGKVAESNGFKQEIIFSGTAALDAKLQEIRTNDSLDSNLFERGVTVNVCGTVHMRNGQRELRSSYFALVDDPFIPIYRALQCRALYSTVYDIEFNKINELSELLNSNVR